ncbi:TPA: hypothetical protein ACRZZI_004978 [Vibrio harveyi]
MEQKMTSTERSIKFRNKQQAIKVLCYLYEKDLIPDVVSIGNYFTALENKICRKYGLSSAQLSEEWMQMFVDHLNAEADDEEPAIERTYDLYDLGCTHKFVIEEYKKLLT